MKWGQDQPTWPQPDPAWGPPGPGHEEETEARSWGSWVCPEEVNAECMCPAAGRKAETQRAQTPQAAPRAAFTRGGVPSLGSDLASPERTRSFPSILAARAHPHCHAETGERGGCLRAGGCRSVTHRSRAAMRSQAPRQAGAPLAPWGEAAWTNPRRCRIWAPKLLQSCPHHHPFPAGRFI